MKILKQLLLGIACIPAAIATVNAQQDSTGMPGDNFSLQGALAMFKQAGSPEEFEKLINTEDKNVNNLDLNGDGEIDYIKVIDNADKDVHAFVLQVAISESENQDIAVIELEKTGDTTAVLQIIGDKDIFGEEIIVEASEEGDEAEDSNAVSNGPAASFDEGTRVVVNVFFWPGVRYVYRPVYRPWVSPWRWHHYPGYWRPWRPYAWHVFNPRRVYYHRHFAIVHTHRVVAAHRFYTPRRVTSVTVRSRTTVARNNYKVTRTTKRTIVTRPGGNKVVRKRQNLNVQRNNAEAIEDRKEKRRGRRG